MAIQQLLILATAIAAAGGAAGATLNSADKSGSLTLSGGDLTVTNTVGGAWAGVRATNGKSTGKVYYELKKTASGGAGGLILGFSTAGFSLSTYPGSSGVTMGWIGDNTGRQCYAGGSLVFNSGTAAGVGEYYGVALDIDNGKGWVRTSNVAGWANGGNPSTGVAPTFTFTPGTTIFPEVAIYYSGTTAEVNFGGAAFYMTTPLGYASWDGTAPTYTDPLWPNVVLLMPAEGSAGAALTDLAGRHTFTKTGTADVITTDANFPSGALDLPVGGYVTVNGNTDDWIFGTGDFCLEGYFDYDTLNTGDGNWLFGNYAGAGNGLHAYIPPAGGALALRYGDAYVDSRAMTLALNTKYHWAIARKAGVVRFFLDGVKQGTDCSTYAAANVTYTTAPNMGAEGAYTGNGRMYGREGWLRITAGDSRYWADFTPPSTPYDTV